MTVPVQRLVVLPAVAGEKLPAACMAPAAGSEFLIPSVRRRLKPVPSPGVSG